MSLSAQDTKQQTKLQDTAVIEGLNLYPNPGVTARYMFPQKMILIKR
jgi:hypothetical protein